MAILGHPIEVSPKTGNHGDEDLLLKAVYPILQDGLHSYIGFGNVQ